MTNRIYKDDDIFPAFEKMLENPERFPFERCHEHPKLFCCAQKTDGKMIIVYCFKQGNKGEAVAIFLSSAMDKGALFFNLLYAVAPAQRGIKIGRKIVLQSIDQFLIDMKKATFEPKLSYVGIETYVGIHNLPSQKLSHRFVSGQFKIITDTLSKKPQYHYRTVHKL